MGYTGKTKFFSGRPLGWRLQLNIRNLLDRDDIEPLRSNFVTGAGLHWGRVEPRQVVVTTTFTKRPTGFVFNN